MIFASRKESALSIRREAMSPSQLRGVVPGSGFADIPGALSNTDSPHLFTLPSAAKFSQSMEALSVGEGTRVVLYDTTYSMWATRVWWMLQAFGFEKAGVLDGGFTAWQAAGARISNQLSEVQSAKFSNVSVNDLKTPQVSAIYDVVNRHLSDKFGVYVPFPNRDNNG